MAATDLVVGIAQMTKPKLIWAFSVLAAFGAFGRLEAARCSENGDAGKPGSPKAEFETGKLIRKVVTKHDPKQSYAMYLPKNYDPGKKWPILYGFSPGARGVNPVYLFQPAAEKYGWIVVGSNNSRNGPWQPISAAVDAILKDTEARLAIDKSRRYTTGFSGGARVGFYVATQHKFAGTIPVGAGMSRHQKQPEKGAIAVFSVCGTTDFNHAELLRMEGRLRTAGVRNRMTTFVGGHKWPGRDLCGAGLRYMEFLWQLQRGKQDEKQVEAILKAERNDAEKLLEAKGQYLRGYLRLKELHELHPQEGLRKRIAEIEATEKYKKEKQLDGAIAKIDEELKAVKDADQRFRESVRRYTKFIADNKGSEAAGRLAVRLRGTAQRMAMGGAMLMRRKDYRRAESYLRRARIFSPRDSNLAYNLACALARNGKKDDALKMLAESVRLGFKDFDHIKKDADLATLRDDPSYKKLLGIKVEETGVARPDGKEPAPVPSEEDEDQAVPLL